MIREPAKFWPTEFSLQILKISLCVPWRSSAHIKGSSASAVLMQVSGSKNASILATPRKPWNRTGPWFTDTNSSCSGEKAPQLFAMEKSQQMELWEKKQFRLTGWVTALAVWQQIQPADRSDDEKIVHLYSPDVKYFIMKIFAVGQKMTHQITVDNFLITKKKKVYISEQVNASSVSFVIVLMYCLHRYYGLCYTK